MEHYSVMLHETISLLNIKEDGIYVDLTLGRGGHTLEILKRLTTGHVYGFDQDITAINETKVRLEKYLDKITFVHSNFANFEEKLHELGVTHVDGILMDLGVSSPQFDDAERGFSYRFDARLDMRMNQNQSLSAYEVVNDYDLKELTSIFREYGEEKFAYEIAKKIVKVRETKPIETTFELVDVIKSALPQKVLKKKGHPAKQVFQAIRIEVNDELNVLKIALNKALKMIKVGGRIAVITFHSLEDRIVKKAFKEVTTLESTPRNLPTLPINQELNYVLVNKHPIEASEEELEQNSRSQSAKLRGIEKVK